MPGQKQLPTWVKLITSIFLLNLYSNSVFADHNMGVFPHLPPRDLEKVFSPMAADLGKVLGHRLLLRSNTTYSKFMENLDKEVFDIAFVQPFDYVRIADKYGYIPLATRTEMLSAILVTKDDSPMNSIKDLKGKKIALPPKVSAVSKLMESHLRKNGLIPGKDVTLSYHRSHVSCMQQIMIGEADTCTTAAPAMRFFQHKMNVKLKIIASSQKIPHTLFAIHPRIPKAERERVRKRILGWSKTDEGKALLKRGKLKPFRKVSDSDYDIVRKLAK
ncbi:MAG: phosphate/phosphite/phosphonate ABC transporter substrate-binding protein [Gammaproteobacteria bacterium]|nr:phosphate/phosphite/phosphonate ABC transporter substrate-binding protein [Gammaproteobacteria bacterium]